MKTKTRKRVLLTMALAAVMLFAMTIVSAAGTTVANLRQTYISDSSVTFEWDPDLSAYGYNIYWSTSPDASTLVRYENSTSNYDVTGTKKSIYGLAKGGKYYVSVAPVYRTDLGGYKYAYSEGEKSASIVVVTNPGKPTEIHQTNATTKSVTLSWTAPYGASGYNIYRDNVLIATTDKTSVTLAASAGSKDWYKVVPFINGQDKSYEGSYEGINAKAAPGKPMDVANSDAGKLDWNPQTNKCKVSFTKNTKDAYEPDGYRAEIYTVDGKKKLKTIDIKHAYYPSVEFAIKKVKAKGFQIRVQGYVNTGNNKCYGLWSKKKVVVPQAYSSLKQVSQTSVKVSWKKVSGATKYYVYGYKNGSYSSPKLASFKLIKTVNAKTTSITVKGCKLNNYHYFYVVPAVKVGKKTYIADPNYHSYIRTYSRW